MPDLTIPITVYGDVDQRAVEQLQRCADAGDALRGVLCADGHVGYSQPIGGALAYPDYISPSGVGYDIACGNKAVRTNIFADDIDVAGVMDEIVRRISFGVGRVNDEPADHAVLDAIKTADFAPQRQLYDLAAKQLGTVGAGNHYVDLFVDEDKFLWVGCHFGSRGFGHRTATGFLALAAQDAYRKAHPEIPWNGPIEKHFFGKGVEGEMDSPPILFHVDSDLGQAYITAMELAGQYAYAGRDVVIDKVLEILGAETTYEVHNHHNFAWRERHQDTDVWVVRKGCTPAFPDQEGFVGATMGEPSVILKGVDSDASRDLLYSTVHGAGRVMSRTQAAGKFRHRWACNNRDCDWTQPNGTHKPEDDCCPDCGSVGLSKRRTRTQEGEIDWDATLADLAASRIELRGGAADEAPGAYKRLDAVLAAHEGTIEITHRLTPIGVAMAGADTFDPYKD
jgi:tRNA-splicing ligase RtcB